MHAPLPASDYRAFLERKVKLATLDGFAVAPDAVNPALKPHIRAIVPWLLAGGKRAFFGRFGTQKTTAHLECMRQVARHTGGPTLIVLPLGARQEFYRDARLYFTGAHAVTLKFIQRTADLDPAAINLTNVESIREEKVDPGAFAGASWDEADILRSFAGTKTFRTAMRVFERVPYRFVMTATPDPNEFIELLAYAAWLDIMDVGQAKTRFFKRNAEAADKLTLHAHKEEEFWLWVASWALFLQRPSDLGPDYSDEGYVLPELDVRWHEVKSDHGAAGADRSGQGRLFRNAAAGVADAAREKRDTLGVRVAKLMALRAEDPSAHRLIWHDLEAERVAIEKAVPNVVAVTGNGSQSLAERERAIVGFAQGDIRELAGKPVMIGAGCNFQGFCWWSIFLGIGFKFRDFIQAVHRTQRYGQMFYRHPALADGAGRDGSPPHPGRACARPGAGSCGEGSGVGVDVCSNSQRPPSPPSPSGGEGVRGRAFLTGPRVRVDLIYTEAERETRRSLEAKWQRYEEQAARMSAIIRQFGLSHAGELGAGLKRSMGVVRAEARGEHYLCVRNDCVAETRAMAESSVDLIVTSIPFDNQYEYTPSYEDFGHSEDTDCFFQQMDFLTPELLRVLRPGRIAAIHCKDRIVPGGMNGLGFQTVKPFGALTLMHFMRHGFAYLGTKTIVTDVVRENNQTYRLGWSEQCKDGTRMGFGLPEYLHVFRKSPSDRANGYADVPVAKSKPLSHDKAGAVVPYEKGESMIPGTGYSRARWQLDAAGFSRSSGNRQVAPGDFVGLDAALAYRQWRDLNLSQIYDFEHHVACCEAREAKRELPKTFALMPAHSWHDAVWSDVTRMRTLNGAQYAKGKELHICPLQFDIVDRAIAQYSMEGEIVLDPFGGLMTVPYRAVKAKRRGIGIELSDAYFRDGVAYCAAAEREAAVPSLFDLMAKQEGEAA